jgi:hypothetical protein
MGSDAKSVSENVNTLASSRVRPDPRLPLGSGVAKNQGKDNETDKVKYFYFRNMIFIKGVNNLKRTRGGSKVSAQHSMYW